MSRCRVVAFTADGKTEEIRAQVSEDFGTEQDAAALAVCKWREAGRTLDAIRAEARREDLE